MKFDIFGGCTSRDLFNLENRGGAVHNYFARSSLVSQYTSKIESLQSIEINLGSKFQKSMVQGDLQKSFYNYFRDNTPKGDYLIIDLLIERLPLIKFQNGLITRTSEYAKIKQDLQIQKETFLAPEEHLQEFQKALPILVQDFRIYKKVFLHKSFLRNQYLSTAGKLCWFENQYKINITNAFLKTLYDLLETNIENVEVLEYPEFYAWEGHRWGLAAYHYESEYYNLINRKIRQSISDHHSA